MLSTSLRTLRVLSVRPRLAIASQECLPAYAGILQAGPACDFSGLMMKLSFKA